MCLQCVYMSKIVIIMKIYVWMLGCSLKNVYEMKKIKGDGWVLGENNVNSLQLLYLNIRRK